MRYYMRTSRRTGVSVGPAGMVLVALGYLVIGTVYLAVLAAGLAARLIAGGVEAAGDRTGPRLTARGRVHTGIPRAGASRPRPARLPGAAPTLRTERQADEETEVHP